ncbi:hypothetical protein FQR65_LT10117 [Abscondita terminalis]|nr:hypothetical protein FQR65_LT15647 [Abscondita terminalis]KAF5296965.1 hypothetical protein FQR65_LT10117 [Abscondita terminalis]
MEDEIMKKLSSYEFLNTFLESSSDESDEDEIIQSLSTCREWKSKIPKIEGYIEKVVTTLNDKQFKSHFRLLRSTCYKVIQQFGNSKFYPKSDHGGTISLSAECHILSFLW